MLERSQFGEGQAGRLESGLQPILDHAGDVQDGAEEVMGLIHTLKVQ
jgi:hypothetical protein